MSEQNYLTFPIILFKNGLNNINKCLDNAMYYCLYDNYLRFQNEDSDEPLDDALDKLGINFKDVVKSFKKGEVIYNSIDQKCPKTSISLDMMFDFYGIKKTEFEIVCLLAFSALKSIIQKQGYKNIKNNYLLSRMSGNSTTSEDIDPLLKHYASRYQLDKIKKELQLNWGLKYYAVRTRGFYVSFSMKLIELAVIAERKNKSYQLKKLQDQIKEASIQAKEKVMSEPLPSMMKNNSSNNKHNIYKT
jgi:hypothetical protein